jgi:hypothetical protein
MWRSDPLEPQVVLLDSPETLGHPERHLGVEQTLLTDIG